MCRPSDFDAAITLLYNHLLHSCNGARYHWLTSTLVFNTYPTGERNSMIRKALSIREYSYTSLGSEAERQLRDSMSIQSVNHRISPLHLKLAVQDTINTCDVLDTAGHASRTRTGIETDHQVLTKNIITLFYRSRVDNIIRMHNSRLHIINTRQSNNHLIIFSSQRGFSSFSVIQHFFLCNF